MRVHTGERQFKCDDFDHCLRKVRALSIREREREIERERETEREREELGQGTTIP